MVIRAHHVSAECHLNWNAYDISIKCEFKMKGMQKKRMSSLKLVVIFSVVSLH